MTREIGTRRQMRPSYMVMTGLPWWERTPKFLTRPVLRLLLLSLSWGLALRSRVSWSVRSQVTRTVTLDITTADGVGRRWLFDGETRRIHSTSQLTRDADHRMHFRTSAQAIRSLTSPRAIDEIVAGLVEHRMQLRGSPFALIWFYGLTRRIVRTAPTRGPRKPIPGGYVRPDPSRDGPERLVREPAVAELDPAWEGAWRARSRLWTVRGGGGEPMPEP